MEKNKYTLITIIVLLVLILPGTIYGTYIHFKTTTNFKREFKFNGKLYFYDGKKLLGTYTCKTKMCDYALYMNEEKSGLINNTNAFIADGEKINLINVKDGLVIATYDAISKGNDSVYYVMQNEKWGAVEITTAPAITVPIGNYDEVRYLNGKYVVKREDQNILYDPSISEEDKKEVFSTGNTIKEFNDNYIVVTTYDSTEDILYDYSGIVHFTDYSPIEEITLIDNYALLKNSNEYKLVTISNEDETTLGSFFYSGAEDLTYEFVDNTIVFKGENGFEQAIEIIVEIPNE